ncbi:MAG: hypothetical protein EOP87_16140, partial [Verrucomicrobiaceae bacterium]
MLSGQPRERTPAGTGPAPEPSPPTLPPQLNLPHMDPAPTSPRRLRPFRDEPFRSCALAAALVSSAFLLEGHAAGFYWDANGSTSSATGGTGIWDTTSELWRLESLTGPLLPWPVDGTNLTAHLFGTAGTLTVTADLSVNNILAASTAGSATTTISGATGSLTLQGPSVPVIDVATGKTLSITTQLSSTAGFTKSGGGTLILNNATNDITGGVRLSGGTLQLGTTLNNTAALSLRSTSIDVGLGSTLSVPDPGPAVKIGSLTGSGTVDVGRTLHLHLFGPANPFSPGSASTHFPSGPVFSGLIESTGLVLTGTGANLVQLPGGVNVSMQTL